MGSAAPTTRQWHVQIDNVWRGFGARQVLSGVEASVQSGQVLVVTGPNGSGKSTLLRIVAGILPADEGRIRFTSGEHELTPEEQRASVGYVAPDLSLYAEMTGVENLRFFGALANRSLTYDELAELLKYVGLLGRGSELVSRYSSGMRQRLRYAFALLANPPILLLDEPTANLDEDGIHMAHDIVESQRATGATIIATNEPRELTWGDQVVHLGAD